ncbi:Lathosterol oxidase, partial [Nipponia nippon]
MDLVLDAADRHLLTPYVYPAGWPEGEPCRQLLSLFVITNLGALALYLLFGTLSYYFVFDHQLKTHPQFLEPPQRDRRRALSPQRFHKPHHLWKIATPFASHAFHPVDGFMQSLPYHVYPFLFPLHKVTYLGLYIFVNVWTISIHDGDYRVPRLLRHVVNGSAHHTDHHFYFDCNYGQYFTLWDKIGGSYKSPASFEGKGPRDYLRKLREK